MDNNFKLDPPSPHEHANWAWSASRRRPAFLLLLVTGLALFLTWLPAEARSSLLAALSGQRGLVILLFLFALVTLSLVWRMGQRLDAWVFTSLNTRGYPAWLDRCMWLVTQLGNALAAFAGAFLLFALHYSHLGIEIIFGTLTLWLLVEVIEALSDRDRPFLTLDMARVIGWRERGDSFPSGHTAQAFFLATLLILAFQLGIWQSIGVYAIVGLVGFTRIYVGAHYPRDVLAGIVLGSVWGILASVVNMHWLAPTL
jgi:membrane-associated phospholipid phosphatase